MSTATTSNPQIVFSRLGEPQIGSPQAFSINVASISGAGSLTVGGGGRTTKERRSFPADLVVARSTLTGEHLRPMSGPANRSVGLDAAGRHG